MKFFFLVLTCSVLSVSLYSDPWGTDADLVAFHKEEYILKNSRSPTILARFGTQAIFFHQEVLSPADGPRSHFIPSSSQYTLDAMQKYGFFEGFSYGCDRLMRENDEPWVYKTTKNPSGKLMKWNPVP